MTVGRDAVHGGTQLRLVRVPGKDIGELYKVTGSHHENKDAKDEPPERGGWSRA